MPTLLGQDITAYIGDLVQVSNTGTGIDGTMRPVASGTGNNSALNISTAGVKSTGTLEVVGDTTLDGSLTVSGATDIANANLTGTATLDIVTATGAVTLESTLDVTGLVTSDNVDVAGTLDVTGAIVGVNQTLSGTLTVTGNTTLNGNINGTGAYEAAVISPTYGGTGVNNATNTLTLAAPLVQAGAFATTLTSTAISNATLPAGTTTLLAKHSSAVEAIYESLYTSTGTYTPHAGLLYVEVYIKAGGGSGASINSTTTSSAASGGGGGEGCLIHAFLTPTQIGGSQTITIGAGGSASNGGTSSLGTLLVASGGVMGAIPATTNSFNAIPGGLGGTGSVAAGVVGQIIPGQCGGMGIANVSIASCSGNGGGNGGGHGLQAAAGAAYGTPNAAVANSGAGGGGAAVSAATGSGLLGAVGAAGYAYLVEYCNQ